MHLYYCIHTVTPVVPTLSCGFCDWFCGHVDDVQAGCCAGGGGVLHSWALTQWTPFSASVGLVTDAADVDGVTAVAADAVVG